MPYIEQTQREIIDEIVRVARRTDQIVLDGPGQLNYVITTICTAYLGITGVRYAHINAVIGALECAKLELYRRLAAPYEDEKIKENGDIEGYVS